MKSQRRKGNAGENMQEAEMQERRGSALACWITAEVIILILMLYNIVTNAQ